MSQHYDPEFSMFLDQDNFLGAWMWVKQHVHEPASQAAYAGEAGKVILARLDRAVKEKNREQEAWLRANLAYVLREYPGLSALYREQARTAAQPASVAGGIIQGVQDTLRDLSDIAEGRVSVGDKIRENLEQASAQLRETTGPAPLVSDLSKVLSEGMDTLGKLMGGYRPPAGAKNDPEPPVSETPKEPPAAMKVKIENADDPLPNHLERAEKGE